MKVRIVGQIIAMVLAMLSSPLVFAQPAANAASSQDVTLRTAVMIGCNVVRKVTPPYPATAKALGATGIVKIAIKVDRQGKVIFAEATEGHALLRDASRVAALHWTFGEDTTRAEEIDGVITFNFLFTGHPNSRAKNKNPKLSLAVRNFEKGEQFAKDGQNEKAILAFKTAIRLDPKYAWAYYQLGMTQRQQRQYEQAEKSCIKARDFRLAELKAANLNEQDLLYENALMCLGMNAAVSLKYDDAISHFRKIIELEPSRHDVRSMLGTVLFHKGDYSEAEKVLQKCLSLKPRDVVALFTLGEVYSAQRRWKDAVDIYKQCIEAEDGPFAPPSHYGLGVAYLRLGEGDAAIKEYQTLKQINNHEKAEQLLQLINQK